MKNNLKLVFLVISADDGIYAQLQQCWRDWAAQNNTDTQTFLVQADPHIHETCLVDDIVIRTPHVECLIPGVLEKTIAAMDFIQRHYTFDYLVRTNLSSFWFTEDYLGNYFAGHLGKDRCYAGYAGMHQGQLFASGAGIIMSPDVVRNVVENNPRLQMNLPDDVAIGQLVQQHKLAPFTPLQKSRFDIVEYQSLPDDNTINAHLNRLRGNVDLTHIRLKNPDRNTDIAFFRKLLALQQQALPDTSGEAGQQH